MQHASQITKSGHEAIRYGTGSVISADGTRIGYREFGHGPAVVLVHGGMQAAQNFMRLGAGLADSFTVFIPDRRGRGLSGPYREDHGIETECEDIDALLRETGAHKVFGLSSGALMSLCAARTSPRIHKLAIYEPPLSVADSDLVAWLPRFDREIAEGKLAAAMLTGIRGTKVSPIFGLVPRFILTPLVNLGIKADAKKVKEGDVPLKEIIPMLHFDALAVRESKGTLEGFEGVRAEVLLLGGSKSPAYLKAALDVLEKTLPHVRRVEFPGLDHLAPDNTGKPEVVAQELRRFFSIASER
jgi:pimeloyl-ACP methyl ester carboxylesterase